jgi:hypothetical protein
VVIDRLAAGTTVYIKSEVLLTKMANRYYGPFTIKRSTTGGNYILTNPLGEEMNNSYPRQKLKVVSGSNEEELTLEIDKIIDSKVIDGVQQFLTRWKDSQELDWLPITAFNSLELVNEFNRRKALECQTIENKTTDKAISEIDGDKLRIDNNLRKSDRLKNKLNDKEISSSSTGRKTSEKSRRGRPKKNKNVESILKIDLNDNNDIDKSNSSLSLSNYFLHMLMLFFILFCKTSLILTLEIQDDFTFCDPNVRTLVDISNSCKQPESHKKVIKIDSNNKKFVHVFDQAKHLISGIAHECSMSKSTVTTYKNFIGQESIEDFDEISLIITAHACEQLVKTKMCNDKQMTCLDGICQSDNKIVKSYYWFEHKKFSTTNCKVIERYLIADKFDDYLFGSLKCRILDGSCNLPNSLIIWDVNRVLHRCPLYYVTTTNITIENNFVISDEDNFIFNIVNKGNFSSCGNIVFHRTSQNLYLSFDDSSLNLPKIENEFFDLNKIRIAENDMAYYKSFETQRKLTFEICLTLENVIRTVTLFEKRFLRLTDSKENELILYVTQGQAFVVKCLNLKNTTINILNLKYDNNFCNTHLVVEYFVGSTRFRGYMGYDNIISPLDKNCLIHCDELNQTYYFKNKNMVLKRIGSTINLKSSNEIIVMKPIDFELSDISRLNFKHSK